MLLLVPQVQYIFSLIISSVCVFYRVKAFVKSHLIFLCNMRLIQESKIIPLSLLCLFLINELQNMILKIDAVIHFHSMMEV